MHDPAFDGRRILLTDAPLNGPFVSATNVKLIYEKDGFSPPATSSGRSLLVLPIPIQPLLDDFGKRGL